MYTKHINDLRQIRDSLLLDLAHYETNKKNCEIAYIRKEYIELMARTENQIKRVNSRIGELEVHQNTHETMIEHDEWYEKNYKERV